MSDIDQDLYDRLDAEADNHAPNLTQPMSATMQRHTFPDWYAGWDTCADVAARISAERHQDDGLDAVGGFSPQATYPVDIAFERHQVTVSDEELARVFADAIEASHSRNPAIPDGRHIIAGIRAVRAALESAKETTNE
jgi:hypothetical protein